MSGARREAKVVLGQLALNPHAAEELSTADMASPGLCCSAEYARLAQRRWRGAGRAVAVAAARGAKIAVTE